jgi:phosphoserine aminotransferase
LPVLERARDELLEWDGAGASVMEISHRSKEFIAVAEQAEADLRDLLAIPADYKVLFLQGGAQLQFAMVPLNLLADKRGADYVNTGQWSNKAIAEARRFAEVNIVASSEYSDFTTVPPQSDWNLDPGAAYVHYTPNETIGGVEFHWVPDVGDVPLVADVSSTILSRPIDVSRFGIIYAGAQKNIGPAGLTIVIVREDLLGRTSPLAPNLFDYKKQAENGSMLNTAPTFAWYMAGLVFQWLKQQGGLAEMAEMNSRKAEKLYAAIDGSGGFYRNPVTPECRSWMNVPFTLVDPELDATFLTESKSAGLHALKGHRSVGGMRASIYNAMPEQGVDALIEFMRDFAGSRG